MRGSGRSPTAGLGFEVVELESGIDLSVPLLHEIHHVFSRFAEIQEVSRRKKAADSLHPARFAFHFIVGCRIAIMPLHRDDQGEQPASRRPADTEALTINSEFCSTLPDEPYGPPDIADLVLDVEYRC